jgi:hypothetical protein
MQTNTGINVDRFTSKHGLVYLSTCLLVYLFIGLQYAALTPAWQVPDEPAHYNFIKHIAQTGSLPELKKGDYDQIYLARLTSEKFPPDLSIDSVRYESWQPPLYYLLATPIFILFNGALLPLRIFSLVLGAGVLVFAYLGIREAVSSEPSAVSNPTSLRYGDYRQQSKISNLQSPIFNLQSLLAVSFLAFIPQHIAMMAGVNNDSLSELIIAIGLWRILAISRQPPAISKSLIFNPYLHLGIVIGLALITKSHAYLLAPVALVMLLLRLKSHQQSTILNLQSLFLVFTPALLLGSTFWGRNLAVYGVPDFMATIRHDSVVIGQPRTSEWIAQYGTLEVARRFLQTTFQSFWGQFGWMGVVMDQRVYIALMIFSALLVIGFIIAISRQQSAISNQKSPISNLQSLTSNLQSLTSNLQSLTSNLQSLISNLQLLITNNFLLLTLSALLTLALYLYYNLTYVQHQGRYLFPALIPISVAVSLSLTTWADFFTFLGDKRKWLAFAPIAMMAALCVFALYRFIIPALSRF